MLLSLRASLLVCSQQLPFFTTAILKREFLVQFLGLPQFKLLHQSCRRDQYGTLSHIFFSEANNLKPVKSGYQADSFSSTSWNLTASGPRPNPQGSYHYGLITPSRTIMLANSAPYINGKQRYAVNGVSYVPADTPLKLADYFKIPGVFNLGSIPTWPPSGNNAYFQTSVLAANFREYVEIVFQNWEDAVQPWHIDGYSFFVVG